MGVVKRRQIWCAAVASVMTVLLAGCASGPGVAAPTPTVSPPVTGSGDELGAAFADCPPGSEVWVSPPDSLANTDRWYHAARVDGERALDMTMPISIVDTEGRVSEARMFGAAWPGIDWALGNGSDVWIATTPDPAGLVQVVMIVTPTGAAFFPGECADKKRAFLQESLGDRTDEVLAELPYLDPSEVHEHLGFPDPNAEQEPSEEYVILNPDDVDASVLEPLELVALYLNAFTHDDHVRLARALNDKAGSNWMLTYDENETIASLYSEREQFDLAVYYSVRGARKANELLIASDVFTMPDGFVTRRSAAA